MNRSLPSVQTGLAMTRRLLAAAGVTLLLGLAFFPEGSFADRLAILALSVLMFATLTSWLEFGWRGRLNHTQDEITTHGSKAWVAATVVIAAIAGVAVQTWFRPGTAIAGGDVVLPDGSAWFGRLLDPWIWGGSTLGEPSQLLMALPWAAVLGLVQWFGGDPATAQRVWETLLFVGAGLGALALLAALRIGPIGAVAGSAIYLLNPYVVTWVAPFDVYIAAMFLLPAVPAALIAAGTGRLSLWRSATLIAAVAPLVGYTFFSPPLVGMIFAAMLASPLVVAWVEGRTAGVRCLRALLLSLGLLLATSAYWIVPAALHLSKTNLSPSGLLIGFNWIQGELRTTIRNAFWLNTRWMWIAPEYFPYARRYDEMPLSALKFVMPAVAFSALAGGAAGGGLYRTRSRNLRLATVAATVALLLVFISTGTKLPGSILFDALYSLPFGWLLQEPERFLMLAALAYSILLAIVIEALVTHPSVAGMASSRRITMPALRVLVAPVAIAIAALVAGFPLYTAALVPDSGAPLPVWAVHARPQHVQMPGYWSEMARASDALPIRGALLVMPPDDFYEMPYTWYYGSDAFISKLFQRRVLVPSSQGYTSASSQLIDAVNLTGQSILHRNWPLTQALVTALNAPLILVRRDIVTPYPNHSILPPNELAASLLAAPNFALVRQIGSLDLFALRDTIAEAEVSLNVAIINSQTPDLRVLSMLPLNTALVSGDSRPGLSKVIQAPPLELWQAQENVMTWHSPAPPGWAYRLAVLGTTTQVALNRSGTFKVENSDVVINYAPNSSDSAVTVSMAGRTTLSNGDFTAGLWEPVFDCNAVAPAQAATHITAGIVRDAPNGLPSLRLSALLDSACERQTLDWHGGSLVLSLMVRHVKGSTPRICVWQTGPERCAAIESIPDRTGWIAYRTAVNPEAGTRALTLHLYADMDPLGDGSINEYADIRALEVVSSDSVLPGFALLGSPDPQMRSLEQLVVVHSAFSTAWQGPSESHHVLVDGMLNGWFVGSGLNSNTFSAKYSPATVFWSAGWLSVAVYFAIAAFALWNSRGRLAKFHLGSHILKLTSRRRSGQ
jgi:hypothetical protein